MLFIRDYGKRKLVLHVSMKTHGFLLGSRLQKWPRLKKYIEACCGGKDVKKSAIFTYEDLVTFVKNKSLCTKYWVVWKAIVAFAYFCGHRCCELRALKMSSVTESDDGIEVEFARAKQCQEIKVNYCLSMVKKKV